MILTEIIARTKYCCSPKSNPAWVHFCEASRCNGWRWTGFKGEKEKTGFCGMAGVPFELTNMAISITMADEREEAR